MKKTAILMMIALSAFVVSCAPPFETQNAKSNNSRQNPNPSQKAESEETVFEVQPAISNATILQLPQTEQRIGTGKNVTQLGRLEVSQSKILRLQDGKLIKFTGKGKLGDQTFDIELSGEVASSGRAMLFPSQAAPRRDLRVRGMAVCLDVVAESFKCLSLFVDVYVRFNSQTYTQQFQLISSASADNRKTTPTDKAPRRASPQDRPQPPVQELPVELTPEQEQAHNDQEMEEEPTHEGEDGSVRTGRFVGYQNEVNNLFKFSSLPPGAVLDDDEDADSAQTAPVELTSEQRAEGTTTQPVVAESEKSSSSAQTQTQEEELTLDGAHTLLPQTQQQGKTQPPQSGGLVFTFKPTSGGSAVQNVVVAPSPQQAAKANTKPATKPTTQPPVKQQTSAQGAPSVPSSQSLAGSSQTSNVGQKGDQASGCYSSRGLGAQCNRGGNLRNASTLPMLGIGFRFLYPQRRMWFGTQYLVNVLIDLGKKMNELLPGYRIPIYDMSSEYGSVHPPRQDGGHQNGLEADIGFITTTSPPPMVVIVQNGAFRREIVKMDEQLKIWKHVVKVNAVSKIFVDQIIKRAFCSYARSLPQDADVDEALRKLRHAEGHRNHWHLRLKCPSSSPRCQDDFPVPSGTGC